MISKHMRILTVLFAVSLLPPADIMAITVTDCFQNVCASITVPECVAPDSDIEVLVEGDVVDGNSWSTFAYKLYKNSEWSYSDNHMVDFGPGSTPIDENGFNWGSHYSQTYTLNSIADVSSLAFAFGDRTIGHTFKDLVVDTDIDFSGVTTNVALDIKPQSCPNPINVGSKGMLSAAIVGSEDFDVSQVDPSSVQLAGVAPVHHSYEDVTTPYLPLSGEISSMSTGSSSSKVST